MRAEPPLEGRVARRTETRRLSEAGGRWKRKKNALPLLLLLPLLLAREPSHDLIMLFYSNNRTIVLCMVRNGSTVRESG
jgi:hypothetical protein